MTIVLGMGFTKACMLVLTGLLLTSVSHIDSSTTTTKIPVAKATEKLSTAMPSGRNDTSNSSTLKHPSDTTISANTTLPTTQSSNSNNTLTSKSVKIGSTQVATTLSALTSVQSDNTSNNNSLTTTQKPNSISDTKASVPVTSRTSKNLPPSSTQTPGSTNITTQKHISTVSPTQKPKTTQKPISTVSPTQKPKTTQKPIITVSPTQKPETTQKASSTIAPTQKTSNSVVSTQKPNVTTPASVSTQTPVHTDKTISKSLSTEKPTIQQPSSHPKSTEKPTTQQPTQPKSTENPTTQQPSTQPKSTGKPTTQPKSTEKHATQPKSTEKPTTQQPTQPKSTEKPTTKQPSTQQKSTEKPTSQQPSIQPESTEKSTTQRPSTQQNSTEKPTSQQPSTQSSSIQPSSSQKPQPSSTEKPSTQAPSASGKTTQPTSVLPGRDEFVYINEIMLDKTGGFQKVELLLSKKLDVTKYMLVMVDGQTNKTMMSVSLKDMVVQKNGLLLVMTFDTSKTLPSMTDEGIGVAIYDTSMTTMKADWTVNERGLIDALVIGKRYDKVSSHLLNILTPGVNPFILDPNKYGITRTISRCSSDQLRSTDMYALINPSFGVDNKKKCADRFSSSSEFSIKIKKIDCKLLEQTKSPVPEHQISVQKIIHYLVKKININCMCGVTRMHIVDPKVHCCDGASVDMKFVAPNEDQLSELKYFYKSFLNSTQHIIVSNQIYPIEKSCHENCCNVPKQPRRPHPQAADNTAKNVKVTVAVIVSCLIVFMIIVIIVIMYMRRKKSAVYQFRMSRLNEEDDFEVDSPDHEDFVGGQEATFDINRQYQ